MDPNQRIFLEEAYRALESAGYTGPALRDFDTGVYVGHSADLTAAYADFVRDEHPTVFPEISVAGNMSSVIASRLAYHLDLRGPCVVVDTACSSSLVAVHIASEALRSGQIRMAVVGSVKVSIAPSGPAPTTSWGSAQPTTRPGRSTPRPMESARVRVRRPWSSSDWTTLSPTGIASWR